MIRHVFLGKLVSFCDICNAHFQSYRVPGVCSQRQFLYHVRCSSLCIFYCPATEYNRLLRNVLKHLTVYTYKMIVTVVM